MLIKCNGKLIDEGQARYYTPHQLPPIGSIIKIHPFKENGEDGPTKIYVVDCYEFNLHRSWNNSYKRDDAIMHVKMRGYE